MVTSARNPALIMLFRIDAERMGKICKKLKEPDPWPNRFSQTIKEQHNTILRRVDEMKEQEFVLVLWKALTY